MLTLRQFLFERKYCGKQGAGAIIKSSKTGRYLLALRSDEVMEPNTWGIWGGKIDSDEVPVEAVLREIDEELGNITIINKPKLLYTYHDKENDFKYYNFLIIVKDEFKPDLNWEHNDAEWFSLDKFPKKLHFGLKELIKQNVLR